MQHTRLIGLAFSLSIVLGMPALAQSGAEASTSTAASPAASPAAALPSAKTIIDNAVAAAKKDHKTVLVHVGASWCGWCQKLDEVLNSKELGPLLSTHYVVTSLTAMEQDESLSNPGVDSVLTALGLSGNVLPIWGFVDEKGAKIASFEGYPNDETTRSTVEDMLQKSAPHMTAEERKKIIDYMIAAVQ